MQSRTISKQVTFHNPFWVSGLDSRQAAGTYKVDIEEEALTAHSFLAWKRIATHITIAKDGATEYIRIDGDELEDALARDTVAVTR